MVLHGFLEKCRVPTGEDVGKSQIIYPTPLSVLYYSVTSTALQEGTRRYLSRLNNNIMTFSVLLLEA